MEKDRLEKQWKREMVKAFAGDTLDLTLDAYEKGLLWGVLLITKRLRES